MLVTLFDTETTDLVANSARRLSKQPYIIELFALTLQQVNGRPCPRCLAMGKVTVCTGEGINERTGLIEPINETVVCPVCEGERWEIEPQFKEIDTWHSLFNPGVPVPEEVQKITGLDDEQLKGQPKFSDKAAEIQSYLTRAHRVVAHNLSYDKQMVDIELARMERTIVWPEGICTVEATEHFMGYRLSLGKNKRGQDGLHEFLFGESFPNAHRAENDVRPMARCYMELVRRNEI